MIFCAKRYRNCLQLVLIVMFLTTIACNNKTRIAKHYLNDAENAYAEGQYQRAKLHIDSIKLADPKAFNEIRAGFDLMQLVRKAENKRNIVLDNTVFNASFDVEFLNVSQLFNSTNIDIKNLREKLRDDLTDKPRSIRPASACPTNRG